MKKQRHLLVMAACLALLAPKGLTYVNAEKDEVTLVPSEPATVTTQGEENNETLLKQYIQQQFNAQLPSAPLDETPTAVTGLTEDSNTYKIYQALVPMISEVAGGTRTSTQFIFEDLSDIGIQAQGSDASLDKAKAAADAQLDFDLNALVDALLAEHPNEHYWYASSEGTEFEYQYSYYAKDDVYYVTICNLSIKMSVAKDYQTEDAYTVNSATGTLVASSIANAMRIVEKNRNLVEYDRLIAYRDEICTLVDFDQPAAEKKPPFGDPWQLVWVFDGDPDTKAVSEGYAKAFQYLCDLGEFQNVKTYSVSGTITQDTNSNAHMWNIVHMPDNKNYMVDVTNSDTDAIGKSGGLFLDGYASNSAPDTYTYKVAKTDITYTFDKDTMDHYTNGELKLAAKDYFHDTDPNKMFTAHSLTLSGDIGVNFFIDLTNASGSVDSYSITFAWPKGETTIKGSDFIAVDENTARKIYKTTCNVAAKEMADTITATLKNGETVVASKEYSVLAYATTILDHDTDAVFTKELKALAQDMLKYGAYAQRYFAYNDSPLADERFGAYSLSAIPEDFIASHQRSYDEAVFDGEGIHYTGTTLVLKTTTEFRVYFSIIDKGLFASKEITLDGNPVEYVEKDGNIYVPLENIRVRDLMNNHTLKIGDTEVTISPANYIAWGAQDAEAHDVVTALYNFYASSVAYLN